jgi:hypothetical protein
LIKYRIPEGGVIKAELPKEIKDYLTARQTSGRR